MLLYCWGNNCASQCAVHKICSYTTGCVVITARGQFTTDKEMSAIKTTLSNIDSIVRHDDVTIHMHSSMCFMFFIPIIMSGWGGHKAPYF